jgi:hypothetical protein
MRHIGLFTTFITNQPDTVQAGRQRVHLQIHKRARYRGHW